jgi:Outer membrane protein/protective antigen OMA87
MVAAATQPGGRAVCIAALLLVAGLAGRLPAQTATPVIDTIVVINQNIFDEKDLQALPYVARVANALHIKTQASVIRRTILFNQGEPYDSARAVESERALRGLYVFRQVRVDTVHLRNRLALEVHTEDGWSTKPQLNYSSSGGSVTWQAGMGEDNVLGTATSLTALYTKTPDRSSGEFVYLNPHFVARRLKLALTYEPTNPLYLQKQEEARAKSYEEYKRSGKGFRIE